MSVDVKFAELPPELQVLIDFNTWGEVGKTAYEWKVSSFNLGNGDILDHKAWHRMVCGLAREGLLTRERGPSYKTHGQKTIIRYHISDKGKEFLKGLGL